MGSRLTPWLLDVEDVEAETTQFMTHYVEGVSRRVKATLRVKNSGPVLVNDIAHVSNPLVHCTLRLVGVVYCVGQPVG